jgi:hypothetical protein
MTSLDKLLSAEEFIMRFVKGPFNNMEVIVDSLQFPWPLPGIVTDRGGQYEKISESGEPPQVFGSGIRRSAIYYWRPDDREG